MMTNPALRQVYDKPFKSVAAEERVNGIHRLSWNDASGGVLSLAAMRKVLAAPCANQTRHEPSVARMLMRIMRTSLRTELCFGHNSLRPSDRLRCYHQIRISIRELHSSSWRSWFCCSICARNERYHVAHGY